jgi:hypothetical protein
MSGIQQNFAYGRSFGPPPPPTTIGSAYGGGYFAGQIKDGSSYYNLVISPRATGNFIGDKAWSLVTTTTGYTSVINGPNNSAGEAALGADYQAAVFCEGLSIGGYTDWYLPARNELEVLYYFLKPSTNSNNTSSGSNANAVSPEPVSTNYTSGSPAQTSSTAFRSFGAQCLDETVYISSTETGATTIAGQSFTNGAYFGTINKTGTYAGIRAIRRVLA